MNNDALDWREIKSENLQEWRDRLNEETSTLLSGSEPIELSQYNDRGFYHKVDGKEIFKNMRQEWEDNNQVPEQWISRGQFPGIWTAMFDPRNTFSLKTGNLYVLRFYFKEGYDIYDPNNPESKEQWREWDKGDQNPWSHLENKEGRSLEERLTSGFYLPFPNHKQFYEENNYAAALGYSDYISPVILLEDAVKQVEFEKFEEL